MGRTSFTEPQCLYKVDLYLYIYNVMKLSSVDQLLQSPHEYINEKLYGKDGILTSIVPHKTSLCQSQKTFNPLNPELNPIGYLLALLGAHHFLHVSRIRVK